MQKPFSSLKTQKILPKIGKQALVLQALIGPVEMNVVGLFFFFVRHSPVHYPRRFEVY